MAESKFEITHQKILSSGREMFLKNGYERTNLRELCKLAGITTGAFYRHFEDKASLFSALTENAEKGFFKKYEDAVKSSFSLVENGSFQNIWELYKETLSQLIDYIFSDLDSFKLILNCSSGTNFANFASRIAEREVKDTKSFYELLKKSGVKFKPLPENELRLLYSAYYSCIFETVLQNYDKETALSCVETLSDFFVAGWKKVHNLA